MTRKSKYEIEEEERSILNKRKLGATYQEIADVMKISVTTVAHRIKSALQKKRIESQNIDERQAEIWQSLCLLEDEAWKNYRRKDGITWWKALIKIQDKKMMFFGIGKQTINLTNNTLNIDAEMMRRAKNMEVDL